MHPKYNEQLQYVTNEFRGGNYECISLLGNSSDNGLTSLEALQIFYDQIPDSEKYRIVLDIYTKIKGLTKPISNT